MVKPWPFVVVIVVSFASTAAGFGIFNAAGLSGGSRWDAMPRTLGGVERSLDGGLRFSLQGGSYQAYRDLFTWNGLVPSVASFQQTVLQAFGFWTGVDSQTGLGTSLNFVPDLATPVSKTVSSSVRLGAEIDLFASTDGSSWDPGNSSTRAETGFSSVSVPGNLKLTSGTINYPGFAISGADITFNSNPGARYTLTTFRIILAHEIGHALGLTDVDVTSGPAGTFIDDNYNGATASTTLATLTNSFALAIDAANPSLSPLNLYTVPNGNPGFDTPGVTILMETSVPTIVSLSNDDFAGRQFLYPSDDPLLRGDLNFDDKVTNRDIQSMLNALADTASYKASHDLNDAELVWLGDFNGDNLFTSADIKPFLTSLVNGSVGVQTVPEPATFVMFSWGAILLWKLAGRRRDAFMC